MSITWHWPHRWIISRVVPHHTCMVKQWQMNRHARRQSIDQHWQTLMLILGRLKIRIWVSSKNICAIQLTRVHTYTHGSLSIHLAFNRCPSVCMAKWVCLCALLFPYTNKALRIRILPFVSILYRAIANRTAYSVEYKVSLSTVAQRGTELSLRAPKENTRQYLLLFRRI